MALAASKQPVISKYQEKSLFVPQSHDKDLAAEELIVQPVYVFQTFPLYWNHPKVTLAQYQTI